MRWTVIGVAVLATASLSTTSRAGCANLADPEGDVAAATVLTVPDRHLDLRAISLRPTSAALVVTFSDTALDASRKGVWRLTFTSRRTSLFVSAGFGVWTNVGGAPTPSSGFRAGVAGKTGRAVAGAIDYAKSTITVTVPYVSFGSALTSRDTAVTDVKVDSEETLANAGVPGLAPRLSLSDSAGARRIVLTRC
jgi:hypothetical protein